ncbi:MAG: DUF1648 domain-containing protein, partial [Actinobacteria bacterium]|nr:DUF1648 domain-containing protein [Actinomycetota bacterium]
MPKNGNHTSSPGEGKDIGMRKFTRFSFVLLTFLVWQPLVLLAIFWLKIPLEIPTNFDFFGGITGYGEKTQLLILAAISLMIYVEHLLFVGLVPRKADTKGLISMRFSAVSDPSDVSRARSIIIGALTG